ncbi:MAG: hypothetical protein ACREOQ_09470 [Gemmatimonadales bacterium]
MSRRARHAALVLAGALACHPAHPEAQPAVNPCRPTTGTLPRSATATGLAGNYRLHLTATSDANAGRSVDGALRLRPVDDSMPREVVVLGIRDTTSTVPLSGTTDLDPAALGAVRTGSLSAEDPEAPGVLVIERRPARPDAASEIMLRLGADANRRGVVRYDGGYFALSVRSITPESFAGTWSSGGAGSTAEGYFCADRLASNE